MKRIAALPGLAMLFTSVAAGPTLAGTYTSGSSSLTGVGAQFPSAFDQINITGGSGSFLDAGQLGVNIASGAFVVGVNCNPCFNTASGNINESFSLNGSPAQNFVIHYEWFSDFTTDFLTLSLVTGSLNFGEYTATLDVSPTSLSSGIGSPVPFALTADIVTTAVPEPSTWAMMILGFSGVGFMAYRRKSKPTLVTA